MFFGKVVDNVGKQQFDFCFNVVDFKFEWEEFIVFVFFLYFLAYVDNLFFVGSYIVLQVVIVGIVVGFWYEYIDVLAQYFFSVVIEKQVSGFVGYLNLAFVINDDDVVYSIFNNGFQGILVFFEGLCIYILLGDILQEDQDDVFV